MKNSSSKFKLKSELELFKALQEFGKQSYSSLSDKTGISTSTIQSIFERMKGREFYHISARLDLAQTPELPLAFLAYSEVSEEALRRLRMEAAQNDMILGLIHDVQEVMLILTEESKTKLEKFVVHIRSLVGSKAVLRIQSPTVAKFSSKIPDSVLDTVYGQVPDKRRNR